MKDNTIVRFQELNESELFLIQGGFVIALVAIGSATYAITTGTVVTAVAGAWALGATGYQIYNAFWG